MCPSRLQPTALIHPHNFPARQSIKVDKVVDGPLLAIHKYHHLFSHQPVVVVHTRRMIYKKEKHTFKSSEYAVEVPAPRFGGSGSGTSSDS